MTMGNSTNTKDQTPIAVSSWCSRSVTDSQTGKQTYIAIAIGRQCISIGGLMHTQGGRVTATLSSIVVYG